MKNTTSEESELTRTPWKRVTLWEGSVELLPACMIDAPPSGLLFIYLSCIWANPQLVYVCVSECARLFFFLATHWHWLNCPTSQDRPAGHAARTRDGWLLSLPGACHQSSLIDVHTIELLHVSKCQAIDCAESAQDTDAFSQRRRPLFFCLLRYFTYVHD